MHKLSYGVFILTTKGEKDNGCIINTCVQVANDPIKIAVSVQKENYTREIIEKTGIFNVSVLNNEVPFEVIKHFGMRSGRDVDKFIDFDAVKESQNGLKYITDYTNAFLSAKVVGSTDVGSHLMFVAELTEAEVLDSKPSCTYAHYHSSIKPKF